MQSNHSCPSGDSPRNSDVPAHLARTLESTFGQSAWTMAVMLCLRLRVILGLSVSDEHFSAIQNTIWSCFCVALRARRVCAFGMRWNGSSRIVLSQSQCKLPSRSHSPARSSSFVLLLPRCLPTSTSRCLSSSARFFPFGPTQCKCGGPPASHVYMNNRMVKRTTNIPRLTNGRWIVCISNGKTMMTFYCVSECFMDEPLQAFSTQHLMAFLFWISSSMQFCSQFMQQCDFECKNAGNEMNKKEILSKMKIEKWSFALANPILMQIFWRNRN